MGPKIQAHVWEHQVGEAGEMELGVNQEVQGPQREEGLCVAEGGREPWWSLDKSQDLSSIFSEPRPLLATQPDGKSPETQTSLETPLCHPSLVSSFTNTLSASAPSSDPLLGTQ